MKMRKMKNLKKLQRTKKKNSINVRSLTWVFKETPKESTSISDNVEHPKHYTSHPSGVECIQITEHMNFNCGNAVKYIWRHSDKDGVEDLKKAQWYIEREIQRLASPS